MEASDFEVQVMDDPDHEDLIAEVLYKGEFCFLVHQEQGFKNLVIKLQSRTSGEAWEFALHDFESALSRVKERLWQLRRVDRV